MQNQQPLIPASTQLPELTFKVYVLSILLAIILAAANVYMALKIGLTIAASIPASVLAIGILRLFKNSNVLECNIIQTAASAGEGVAAAVAYVLPALVILQFWAGFPYWETTLLTALGGVLGVLFSIPLRRVLLNMPTLRFPEGTAIGNILKMTAGGAGQIRILTLGALAGAVIAFGQTGLKIAADMLPLYFSLGTGVVGLAIGFAPAPIASGFIVGIEVCLSFFVGVICGWVVLLPMLASHYGVAADLSAYQQAMWIWSKYLRFVGVGTMLVGGVWTLTRLAKPVINGLHSSWKALKLKKITNSVTLRTERDLPLNWVLLGIGFCTVLLLILITYFVHAAGLPFSHAYLAFSIAVTVVFVLTVGFLLSAVCGYITGLVGSSNNPLSGLAIVGILLLGMIYMVLFQFTHAENAIKATVLVILIMTLVTTAATISNENVQDLKAGQMVGSTPWKQQFILAVGVVASSLVIAPVLELLFNAYGIGGIAPRPNMDVTQMLAAPQSSLMAAVAQGVLMRQLEWSMIYVGMGIGVLVILVEKYFVQPRGYSLPVLAVGLGIYLPPEIMMPVILGGVVSFIARRRLLKTVGDDRERIHDRMQNGILLASGSVAGNSLMGVLLAVPFVMSGNSNVLSIMPAHWQSIANGLGVVALLTMCYWHYRVTQRD